MEDPSRSVTFWPISEPFDYGTLNVSLSSKVDVMTLKRIIGYSKSKGSAGYPKLSYMLWRHIACSRIHLPEKLAWLYFDTYWLLLDVPPDKRYYYDQQLMKITKDVEFERHKDSRKVGCLCFIVLLYIQQYSVIGRRSSVYSKEDWPSFYKAPDPNETRRKPCNEDCHLNFLTNHLEELICLLASDTRRNLNDSPIPLESVAGLDFILEGSVDSGRTILPLHQILILPELQASSGFSPVNNSFTFKTLITFLKTHIVPNPFIGENCIKHGISLIKENIFTDEVTQKRGLVVSNSNFSPSNRKLVIISSLYKETLIENSSHYHDAEIKLFRCSSCFLYILAPVKESRITRCKNTTVVIAAAQKTVLVDGCDNIRIVTACRRFVIGNSADCICYLLTCSNPIVLSGNKNIQFAPFNTNFPALKEIMVSAGLLFHSNMWNKPIMPSITSNTRTSCENAEHNGVWSFLPPESFYIINIPVKSPLMSSCSPLPETIFSLPPEYQREINDRKECIEMWKTLTREVALDQEQKKTFQSFVEKQFQIWLKTSGAKKELDQLLHLSIADSASCI